MAVLSTAAYRVVENLTVRTWHMAALNCSSIGHTEYVRQIKSRYIYIHKITFQLVWGLLGLAPIILLLTFFQINGFRYNCTLGGTVNLPTVYNDESSLTCRVNQNQVHLCKLVMLLVEFSALLRINKSIDTCLSVPCTDFVQ